MRLLSAAAQITKWPPLQPQQRKTLISLILLLFATFTPPSLSSQSPDLLSQNNNLDDNDPTLDCKNFPLRPLSHQIYCFGQCNVRTRPIRVKTLEEFGQKCKATNQNQPNNSPNRPQQQPQPQQQQNLAQISLDTLRREFKHRNGGGLIKNVTVFVFDFRLIGGDIFVDFKILVENVTNTDEKNNNKNKNTEILINLVTKQFVTFRIINLPTASEKMRKMRVFLNGDCSVNLMEKWSKQSGGSSSGSGRGGDGGSIGGGEFVEIVHSPVYDRMANRSEWISYLEWSLGYIDTYVEYLSLFCHVTHVRVDLNQMLRLVSGRENFNGQKIGRFYLFILTKTRRPSIFRS